MIRKFYAKKDNTITNAFEENLTTRGTGSNMGASDILETFSIYGQATSSSLEQAKILIEFDVNDISGSRDNGTIPASGSVSWYLKMYNAPHSQTVPSNFNLTVSAISSSWEEGYGIDMEHYEDLTKDGVGSNWIQARHSSSLDNGQWASEGGDFHSSPTFNAAFSTGLEDLEIDVSDLVEQWLDGTKDNNGFGISLASAHLSETKSFFTKKFFGRDTEFHFQKPTLEARWNSSRKDDRGLFYASSSLASASDNLNTLFLYNVIRGRLRDIPNDPTITVGLRSNASGSDLTSTTATKVSTGIYSAALSLDTSETTLYDVWYSGSNSYRTGSIAVKSFTSYGYNPEDDYIVSMPKLKKEYRKNQTHRLNLYVREKNWSPNIYTVAQQTSVPSLIIPSASYQLRRSIDDFVVIPYGTGSTAHTMLSYDVSGNYLNLDTTYLEAGYLYEIQYSFYDEENGWEEQPYRFKFRVVD